MMIEKSKFEPLTIIGLIILPIIIGMIYIIRYGINVPGVYEWDIEVPLVKNFFDGSLSFTDFFAQANESRLLFPRVIMLIAAVITGYNVIAEMLITYVLYCLSFFIIFLMYKKDVGVNTNTLLAFVPISWFFFNLYHMILMLYGVFISYGLMLLGFLIAVYFIDSSKNIDKKFLIALGAAIVSTFSFIAGLTVWPVCLAQLILQESEYKLRRVAAWTIAMGMTFSLYLYGYHRLDYVPSPLQSLHDPLSTAMISFSSLGLPIIRNQPLSPILGLLILIIFICTLLSVKIYPNIILLEKNIKWFSLVLFGIIVAMEIGMGRSSFGLENAIDRRYYSLTFLSVIGLYFIIVNLIRTSNHDYNNIESVNRNNCGDYGLKRPLMPHLNYVLFGCLVSLLFIAISAGYIEGNTQGQEMKQSMSEMAYYLETFEIQPDKNMKQLSPFTEPAHTRSLAAFLKMHSLSLFAKKGIQIDKISELNYKTIYGIDSIDTKILPQQNNTSFVIKSDEVLINGWAIDAARNRPAKTVFFMIDNKLDIPTIYGLKRVDIAEFYKNENYKYTGFKAAFSPNIFQEGSHDLAIIVVSDDGKSYYKEDTNIIFVTNVSTIHVTHNASQNS